MVRPPRFDSPLARLGAYAVILMVALGGGFALGSVVGSDPSGGAPDAPLHGDHTSTTTVPADGHGGDHG
ncbi:MAG TPA: hypothetical protein VIY72_08650 [Acidimicrobiales bacterium]